MKKSIYISILALLFTSSLTFGQVGIGTETPDASAALDVVATSKGFLAPQIALTATNVWAPLVAPATEGMLVYNTTDNATLDIGYYFWDGTSWQPTGLGDRTNIVSDGVIPSILGYEPDGVAATAPASITVDGVTFTKKGCKQWTGAGSNGHWYCGYHSGNNGTSNANPGANGVNWGTAYNVGKALKGYLVTITSDAEWTFVRTAIGTGTGNFDYRNHIWIGNSKAINMAIELNDQPAPGIPIEFYWITGEESKYNWGNTTTVQQNFATNSGGVQDEPNNYNENEGCTHIWGSSMTTSGSLNLQWNDAPCTVTTFLPGAQTADLRALNQLVIEFEQ